MPMEPARRQHDDPVRAVRGEDEGKKLGIFNSVLDDIVGFD